MKEYWKPLDFTDFRPLKCRPLKIDPIEEQKTPNLAPISGIVQILSPYFWYNLIVIKSCQNATKNAKNWSKNPYEIELSVGIEISLTEGFSPRGRIGMPEIKKF